MKTDTLLESAVRRFCSIHTEELSPEILSRVRTCMKDAIENCLSAETDARRSGALASIEKRDSENGCLLWDTDMFASMADAAFYNCLCGALNSRNDIMVEAGSHPGSVIIPTVLCVGEHVHASGKTVIKAILAGYDAISVIGRSFRRLQLPSAYRGTAVAGSFGAAVASAIVMGLDADQVASAASFAVHNSFGLNEWAWAGTGEDVLQNGWCCRHGINAALLARGGVRGAKTIFEGPCGYFAAYGKPSLADEMAKDIKALDECHAIMLVRFKEICACMNVQASAQAAERLARKQDLDFSQIDRVDIYTAKECMDWPGCNNTDVNNLVQAIMSIQFAVAQALVHRNTAGIRWAPPYDLDVMGLIGRCRVHEEPSFTASPQHQQSAVVKVTMRDGRIFSRQEDTWTGLDEREVCNKSAETLSRIYGKDKAHFIEEQIDRLPEVQDISGLVRALARNNS